MATTTNMFKATQPLHVGRARAHNTGDLLTELQVKRGGWESQVEPAGTAEQAEPGARPNKGASKTDWVAYATSPARGDAQVSIKDADELTRDELAALFVDS